MPGGRIGFALAFLSLAACLEGGDVTRGGASPFWFRTAAPKAVRVAGGDIVVQGPQGFCVDPASPIERNGVSFALLGSCASLANTALAGRPLQSAMLTVSVAQPSGTSVAETGGALAAYFATDGGRASLARDGSAASVTVLNLTMVDGTLLVHARDQSGQPESAIATDYWRGFFDLEDRVVTVSVFGLKKHKLSASAGRALLNDLIASLREANRPALADAGRQPAT